MLKHILHLEGVTEIKKEAQREVLGGRPPKKCDSASDCPVNYICQNGSCFNCYAGNGLWYC